MHERMAEHAFPKRKSPQVERLHSSPLYSVRFLWCLKVRLCSEIMIHYMCNNARAAKQYQLESPMLWLFKTQTHSAERSGDASISLWVSPQGPVKLCARQGPASVVFEIIVLARLRTLSVNRINNKVS